MSLVHNGSKQSPSPSASILLVSNSSSLGGAGLALVYCAEALKESGVQPLVVVPEEGPICERLTRVGVRYQVSYQPWWVTPGTEDAWLYSMRLLPQAVAELRDIIRREGIDLVFSNSSVIPTGALAAALERKPHIWMVREIVGTAGMRGPLDAPAIFGVISSLSCKVLANSHALAELLRQAAPEGQVEVSYSGIHTHAFERCQPNHDSRKIVSIGTTTSEKGLDDLVEAIGLLRTDEHPCSVTVLGDFDHESYRSTIQARLRRLNIESHFDFPGRQEDVRAHLDGAAICCQPSHSEGMSRAVLEGMAAGLPVVATDCGGPRDLLDQGRAGVLVPVKQPPALAKALGSLLEAPSQAETFGRLGRERARRLYDLEVTLAAFVKQILQSLRCPPAAPALAQWLLTVLQIAGPRILLGKKWRILRSLSSIL